MPKSPPISLKTRIEFMEFCLKNEEASLEFVKIFLSKLFGASSGEGKIKNRIEKMKKDLADLRAQQESEAPSWWCSVVGETKNEECLCNGNGHSCIPMVKPLTVPEVSTWLETGGKDAVCLEKCVDGTGGFTVGGNRRPHIWFDGDELWLIDGAGFGKRLTDGDLDTAINLIAKK